MLAKKLYKPTGRPIIVHGPTRGHSNVPRGVTGTVLEERLAGNTNTKYSPNSYKVPGSRNRK